MTIEEVEEAKLPALTSDGQLSRSGYIDKVVVNIGRGMSVIKKNVRYSLHNSTVLVVQALVLSHLDYSPVIWSSAAKKDLTKLQLVQNRSSTPCH